MARHRAIRTARVHARHRGKPYQRLVSEVARAFDPGAVVSEGEWVSGPDGRLDMDVAIRGRIDGRDVLAVIECKDFNVRATGKVGREYVDALDSKRHDLSAQFAIICSNSGFTKDALQKARRKGIGMISVLRAGDKRAKVVIEEDVFLRRICLGPWQFRYHGIDESLSKLNLEVHDLRYQGRSVDTWLQIQASLIASANPGRDTPIQAVFTFKHPTEFTAKATKVILKAIEVNFAYKTEWLTQTVELDASLGLYDYLRGKVRLAPGTAQYIIRGVDFDNAVPTGMPPDRRVLEVGIASDEPTLDLTKCEGLSVEGNEEPAPLQDQVIPEDLALTLNSAPSERLRR